MEFFWIKHPKVENPARVPETALVFWLGRGWEQVEAPEQTVVQEESEPHADLIVTPPESPRGRRGAKATEE